MSFFRTFSRHEKNEADLVTQVYNILTGTEQEKNKISVMFKEHSRDIKHSVTDIYTVCYQHLKKFILATALDLFNSYLPLEVRVSQKNTQ